MVTPVSSSNSLLTAQISGLFKAQPSQTSKPEAGTLTPPNVRPFSTGLNIAAKTLDAIMAAAGRNSSSGQPFEVYTAHQLSVVSSQNERNLPLTIVYGGGFAFDFSGTVSVDPKTNKTIGTKYFFSLAFDGHLMVSGTISNGSAPSGDPGGWRSWIVQLRSWGSSDFKVPPATAASPTDSASTSSPPSAGLPAAFTEGGTMPLPPPVPLSDVTAQPGPRLL